MALPKLSDFDLVIFDWAGTMVDHGCCAPVEALLEAFGRHGVTISEAAARADMGMAKVDHVRALLARPEVNEAWRAARGGRRARRTSPRSWPTSPLMLEAAAKASELIPGAAETASALKSAGLKVASSTGYTREMMQAVVAAAAEQGYAPDHLLCSGETPQGRPSPLMIYRACSDLGVWPLSRVIKIDDAEAGIAEGRAAGCFTIGLAASGNGMGLSREGLLALSPEAREAGLKRVTDSLLAAGADMVIELGGRPPSRHGRSGGPAPSGPELQRDLDSPGIDGGPVRGADPDTIGPGRLGGKLSGELTGLSGKGQGAVASTLPPRIRAASTE